MSSRPRWGKNWLTCFNGRKIKVSVAKWQPAIGHSKGQWTLQKHRTLIGHWSIQRNNEWLEYSPANYSFPPQRGEARNQQELNLAAGGEIISDRQCLAVVYLVAKWHIFKRTLFFPSVAPLWWTAAAKKIKKSQNNMFFSSQNTTGLQQGWAGLAIFSSVGMLMPLRYLHFGADTKMPQFLMPYFEAYEHLIIRLNCLFYFFFTSIWMLLLALTNQQWLTNPTATLFSLDRKGT